MHGDRHLSALIAARSSVTPGRASPHRLQRLPASGALPAALLFHQIGLSAFAPLEQRPWPLVPNAATGLAWHDQSEQICGFRVRHAQGCFEFYQQSIC